MTGYVRRLVLVEGRGCVGRVATAPGTCTRCPHGQFNFVPAAASSAENCWSHFGQVKRIIGDSPVGERKANRHARFSLLSNLFSHDLNDNASKILKSSVEERQHNLALLY